MDKQATLSIRRYFEERREELIADLLELIRAESPSNNKEYANRCCDVLCGIVQRRLGVTGTRFPQEQYGDHVMIDVGGGPRKVLLIGHYDTVWDVGALKITRSGDIVRGPGCFDMKYGISSSIWALKAVFDLQLPFDKTVRLFYNSDEEVGSRTSMPLFMDNPAQYEAALILEPAHLGGIKTQRKGVGGFTITIDGVASHAGGNHEDGVSAIDEAARVITYLHSLTDYDAGTTVNVGVIQGGTRSNVVAAQCVLKVDLRVRTAAEGERMVETIRSLTPSREGISITVTGGLSRPPFEKTPGNVALYKALCRTAEDMSLEIFEIASGGGSDGNFTSQAGIPTLDGLGAVGGGAHADDEHVDLRKSLEHTMLLTAFLAQQG